MLDTHDFNFPKKCKFCGKGNLEEPQNTALLTYDPKSHEVKMSGAGTFRCIPLLTLVCDYCGHIELFAANKAQSWSK
jgi:hypothetical protein